MKASHRIHPVFDDPNLIGSAGLVPALRLAERAGFHDLLERISVPSPNAVAKSGCVVAGMLAEADTIDGLDRLRHGGMGRVFTGVRAPSALGTFLRSFTHGHVQQLDAVNRRLLVGLTREVPDLLTGGPTGAADGTADGTATGAATGTATGTAINRSAGGSAGGVGLGFVDVDDTIRQVHGHAKQGAAVGYTRVRGLNVQLATLSTTRAAPVIVRARLRRGNTASFTGAPRLVAEAIGAAREAGVTGRLLVRADSAYFGARLVNTVVAHQAWFSVTARLNPTVKAAIAAIPEQGWTPIRYARAVWDPGEERWISDAEVAEIDFTAFTRRRHGDQVRCRLVVRRVKPLRPAAGDGTVQGELFAAHRHHGFITNSTLSTVAADQAHRDHAVVEQVIAELKDGPLAHLPSGSYPANAAWVAFAVIAFNLARAIAVATGQPTARWATIRTRIINLPARIATTGRRLVLHLPRQWAWAPGWQRLWDAATGPPLTPT